jgi:hypothetical protein
VFATRSTRRLEAERCRSLAVRPCARLAQAVDIFLRRRRSGPAVREGPPTMFALDEGFVLLA